MCFLDVVFLPSVVSFCIPFLRHCVEVKALQPSHVHELWLGIRKECFLITNHSSHTCEGLADITCM